MEPQLSVGTPIEPPLSPGCHAPMVLSFGVYFSRLIQFSGQLDRAKIDGPARYSPHLAGAEAAKLHELLRLEGGQHRWDTRVLTLLENLADHYLYRNHAQFLATVKEFYRHTNQYRENKNASPAETFGEAAAGGKKKSTCTDAYTLFLQNLVVLLQGLWERYFATDWDRLDALEEANRVRREVLLDHENSQSNDSSRASSDDELGTTLSREDHALPSYVDGDEGILSSKTHIVLLFESHSCPSSRAIRPAVIKASKELYGQVDFGTVDVESNPNLCKMFGVTKPVRVILLRQGRDPIFFPKDLEKSAANIIKFAKTGEVVQKAGAAQQWMKLKAHQKTESALRRLQHMREFVTMIEKLKALGFSPNRDLSSPCRPHGPEHDPPTIIFMGGGMGSGKSTVVNILTKSEFWKRHGHQVVIIEADAMKMKDPVYQALSNSGHSASHLVHSYSVQAAEELFVSALRARRDIVFDGTMSWAPFVQQTIAMVRDNNHVYRRGPGYVSGPDGATECYWQIAEECKTSNQVPYLIKLVGVTVEAEIAVQRGIVRKLVTTRGVPIPGQLRSHKLFSESFPLYSDLCDEVELYDNSASDTLIAEEPSLPNLIAWKRKGGSLEVKEPEYTNFLKKRELNMNATSSDGLYPETYMPPTPEDTLKAAFHSLRTDVIRPIENEEKADGMQKPVSNGEETNGEQGVAGAHSASGNAFAKLETKRMKSSL